MKIFPMLLASFVLCVHASSAAIVTVAKNGAIKTIQAGINAAAEGDTVRILTGTYVETVKVPLAKPGLILQGKGKVIVDGRGPGGAPLGPAIDIASNGARVRGLTIRHAATLASDFGVGIRVIGESVLIDKCTIEANETAGVFVVGESCTIRKCSIASCSEGISAQNTAGLRVEFSSIRDCDAGIQLATVAGVVIDKCVFTGIDDEAIIAFAVPPGGMSVTRCAVKFCSDNAIVLLGDDCTIAKTKVLACGGGVGILGNRAVIEDCTLDHILDDSAIAVQDSQSARVEGNVVKRTTTFGIILFNVSNGLCVDNVVTNSGLGREPAVVVFEGVDVEVRNVDVVGCADDAFFVADGAGHVLRDCSAKNCARDGFDITEDSSQVRLENCRAEGCEAEGIANSGTQTELVDCFAAKNRLDFANDGTLAVTDIVFKTGGANVPPQID